MNKKILIAVILLLEITKNANAMLPGALCVDSYEIARLSRQNVSTIQNSDSPIVNTGALFEMPQRIGNIENGLGKLEALHIKLCESIDKTKIHLHELMKKWINFVLMGCCERIGL